MKNRSVSNDDGLERELPVCFAKKVEVAVTLSLFVSSSHTHINYVQLHSRHQSVMGKKDWDLGTSKGGTPGEI